MGLFDKVKKTTIESRRYEEKLYEVALEEVEAGERRKGLYAKALSKADGDTEKADGIYLKLRVQSIMDDIESEQINRRENVRALRAIQALESENTFQDKASQKRNLENECMQILNSKGYTLNKSIFGKYWIGSGPEHTDWNYGVSNDLKIIKEWAINAEDLT